MTEEYSSTFSINQDRWYDPNEICGLYNQESKRAVIFLDALKYIRVNEGGSCGGHYLEVGIEYIPWKPDAYYQAFLKYPVVITRRKNKWLRQTACDKYIGESEVLKEIIKTDFHEFIHHFLTINKISNDCCDEEKHQHDSKNMIFGECWLCNFTHNIKVDITSESNAEQHFEVVQGFHNTEAEAKQ